MIFAVAVVGLVLSAALALHSHVHGDYIGLAAAALAFGLCAFGLGIAVS